MASGSGWNLWMWLAGGRCGRQEVGSLERPFSVEIEK